MELQKSDKKKMKISKIIRNSNSQSNNILNLCAPNESLKQVFYFIFSNAKIKKIRANKNEIETHSERNKCVYIEHRHRILSYNLMEKWFVSRMQYTYLSLQSA